MEQSHGFRQKGTEDQVCKLHKAIYGLKQAPNVWFEKIKETMIRFGYHLTKPDNSLFTKFSKDIIIYVLIYVNDFIITGKSEQEINSSIKHLNQEFTIKDFGNLNYFMGIEVKRISNTSTQLNQRRYITEILHKAKMNQVNPISTPMVNNIHLSKYKGEAMSNDSQYRSIVGALQYANITRPRHHL